MFSRLTQKSNIDKFVVNKKINIMKTKLLKGIALTSWVAVIFFTSCSQNQKTENSEKSIGSTEFRKHLIEEKEMQTLSSEYEKVNYAAINALRKPDAPDAREVYYDVDVLEGYIAYVKEEAKKKGVVNPQIKIVFGQYPEDQPISDKQDPKYLGYQTVYLRPTENQKINKAEIGAKTADDDGMGSVPGLDYGDLKPPY